MRPFKEERLPERMKALPRDRRGLPVPFIVAFGKDGTPHFTINDHRKVEKVLIEDRCGICGQTLHRKRWFVGGPRSAFETHGRYIDPPMHKECAVFALETCPYLAVKDYGNRIDDRLARADKAVPVSINIDPTMIPDQPKVFVLSAVITSGKLSKRYTVSSQDGFTFHLGPKRPWRGVEFWRGGVEIDRASALEILKEDITDEWESL